MSIILTVGVVTCVVGTIIAIFGIYKHSDWLPLTGIFISVFGGYAIALGIQEIRCRVQWEQSGMQSQWSMFQGCLVQREDKTWIPSENFRDLD